MKNAVHAKPTSTFLRHIWLYADVPTFVQNGAEGGVFGRSAAETPAQLLACNRPPRAEEGCWDHVLLDWERRQIHPRAQRQAQPSVRKCGRDHTSVLRHALTHTGAPAHS